MYQKFIAFLLLVISFPLILVLSILIKYSSKGPFIFKQNRIGKDSKIFTLYKIRTMVENAEELRDKYKRLNEADGPVFKIQNDPRYTKIGKLLSRTGLDELPQLVNVLKGEMAFVGPRPLPVYEGLRIPKKYRKRFSVLPGITSPWVVKGAHKLSFKQWMELDLNYVKRRSMVYDIAILFLTVKLISSVFVSMLFRSYEKK